MGGVQELQYTDEIGTVGLEKKEKQHRGPSSGFSNSKNTAGSMRLNLHNLHTFSIYTRHLWHRNTHAWVTEWVNQAQAEALRGQGAPGQSHNIRMKRDVPTKIDKTNTRRDKQLLRHQKTHMK